MLKKHLWTICYSIFLTAFTVYVMLDTFVIARVYTEVPENITSSIEETEAQTNADSAEEIVTEEITTEPTTTEAEKNTTTQIQTDNYYSDENITITLTEYREYNTVIYVADVKLSSAEYLKTALARGAYGKNVTEKTSKMASDNNAILAINGDYYGAQERGYVLRNGVLYRNTVDRSTEDLVIYDDGSFEIINESKISANELLQKGAKQILSFGPALVIDSKISVNEGDEVGKAMSSNPRTAIGIIDELHYVLVVSDGRTRQSEGLSLLELAEFMTTLNVKTAYNLDGGGSSTMVFNGKVINNPTTNGKNISERSVSDIVYIGY